MALYSQDIVNANEALVRLLLEHVTNSDAKVSEAAIYGLKRLLCSSIDKKLIPKALNVYLQPFEKSLPQTEKNSSTSVTLNLDDLTNAVITPKYYYTLKIT